MERLVLVILLWVRLVFTLEGKAFPLSAFDCENPSSIITQQLPKDCQVKHDDSTTDKTPKAPAEDYSIVKQVDHYKFQATLCQVFRTRHFLLLGLGKPSQTG